MLKTSIHLNIMENPEKMSAVLLFFFNNHGALLSKLSKQWQAPIEFEFPPSHLPAFVWIYRLFWYVFFRIYYVKNIDTPGDHGKSR